jgi:cold shock CspA family protein
MTESTTKTGKIRRLETSKGYGFIQPDQASPDDSAASVFFHRSVCDHFESLAHGDAVSYMSEPSLKGERASTVAPI